MSTNGVRQSLERELDRQIEIHRDELTRLALRFNKDRIEKVRDTWFIPAALGTSDAIASDVNEILRVIRRSLQQKTGKDGVSVLIDPEDD